jgi:hypothetical protein
MPKQIWTTTQHESLSMSPRKAIDMKHTVIKYIYIYTLTYTVAHLS